jgi:putative MATE family efflux protein
VPHNVKKSVFGNRQFYANIITIGLPVALQNLFTTSAGMVDTIMIGSTGELSVAAVGICAQFSFLMFAGYFGFCNGGMIFFAQYWGARDEEGICRSYGITLICMMIIGFIFGGLAIFAPEFIMAIYTNKESIQAAGVPYLRIVGWSYPMVTLTMAIGSLLRSTEKVRVPLFASVFALVTNFLLNWLLIFGKLGFPKMGASGAAIGTVASNAVYIVILYVYCLRDPRSFVTRVKAHFKWTLPFIKEFFTKIIFVVCNEVMYGVGMLILNIIIGRQLEAGIAAMAVFRVIEGLIFGFFGGLANASAVMVGKRIGAGEHSEGLAEARRFIVICPAITLTICLIILPFRDPLLNLFGLGPQAHYFAKSMLLIYTLTGTIRTCNYMNNNIFRSGGESVFGTVIEICGLFFISIPAAALAGLLLHWPFLAVFFLLFLDEFLRLGIILWYMNTGRWVKPVTTMGRAKLAEFRMRTRGRAR